MEVSGPVSLAAQQMGVNNAQAGYDVLTKSLQKTEQTEQQESQRMQVAAQTGKGQNIDIKA